MGLKPLNTIKFAFVGDLMLGGEFLGYASSNNLNYLDPFHSITQYFTEADICSVNLEGPIYKGANKRSDITAILSNHSAALKYFKENGLFVLNLANNHIMDYGVSGLKKTLRLIKANSLQSVGAGLNIHEAGKELIIEVKGRTIAFLGLTSNKPNIGAIIADASRPGSPSFENVESICSHIKKLHKKVDIICVSLHWGYEYFKYPSYSQLMIAHSLVESGANYIIGHHPHVVQGVEMYKGSLIMYSLGNFFMPPFRFGSDRIKIQGKDEREFMMILSEIDGKDNIKYKTIGGYLNNNYRLNIYKGSKQRRFDIKVADLSKPIRSDSYNNFWNFYKKHRQKQLQLRSIVFALKKLFKLRLKDIKTINFSDLKRQLVRVKKIVM